MYKSASRWLLVPLKNEGLAANYYGGRENLELLSIIRENIDSTRIVLTVERDWIVPSAFLPYD